MKNIQKNKESFLYFIDNFDKAIFEIESITTKTKGIYKVNNISNKFGKILINITQNIGDYTYILKDVDGNILDCGILNIYDEIIPFKKKDSNITFKYK